MKKQINETEINGTIYVPKNSVKNETIIYKGEKTINWT